MAAHLKGAEGAESRAFPLYFHEKFAIMNGEEMRRQGGYPMDTDGKLIWEMIQYYDRDPKRVGHFLKVYGYAKAIGEAEALSPQLQQILETAAIVHDIGIRASLKKHKSSAGPYQEREGPPLAKAMLEKLKYPPELIGRVCYLVGHHHTYTNISGLDYQILVEADFLVNMEEDGMELDAIRSIGEKIFCTDRGKAILRELYLKEERKNGSRGSKKTSE